MPFCQTCGSELQQSDKFCGGCGAKPGMPAETSEPKINLEENHESTLELPAPVLRAAKPKDSPKATLTVRKILCGLLSSLAPSIVSPGIRNSLDREIYDFIIHQHIVSIDEPEKWVYILPISYIGFCVLLFLSSVLWKMVFGLKFGYWFIYLVAFLPAFFFELFLWFGDSQLNSFLGSLVLLNVVSVIWTLSKAEVRAGS